MSLAKLQQDRNTLIEQLTRLEEKIKKEEDILAALDPIERLAVELHDAKCTWNHTDGCGWFYEIRDGKHEWAGSSHGAYLKAARKLISCSGSMAAARDKLNAFLEVENL
jgi:hypothetical protein